MKKLCTNSAITRPEFTGRIKGEPLDMKKNALKPVEIPVNLDIGYSKGSDAAIATKKIETTAIHIESLFNLIKLARYGYETLNVDENQFLEDIANVSELGAGLAASLFDSVIPFNGVNKNELE